MTIRAALFGDSEYLDVCVDVIKYLKQKGKDTPSARQLLLNSAWSRYCYCMHVEDVEDVWKTIDTDYGRYMYCHYIKDREYLWSKIRDKAYADMYCTQVSPRPEVLKYASAEIQARLAKHGVLKGRWRARRYKR